MISLRPNYFVFIGYFKSGGREGVRANPLNPVWIRHSVARRIDVVLWFCVCLVLHIIVRCQTAHILKPYLLVSKNIATKIENVVFFEFSGCFKGLGFFSYKELFVIGEGLLNIKSFGHIQS